VVPQDRYFRIQHDLTHANEQLDDASQANIAMLENDARRTLDELGGTLEKLYESLL
jgi:hypothetical protein